MNISKVEFCGSYNRTFRNIEFYFNPITSSFEGDVKIRDYQLYIKNERVPIRETLIGSAYNEFIMAVHGGQKFYSIYFKLDSSGGYLVRHEYQSNTVSLVLDSIFSIGMEKRWRSPSLSEKDPRK